MDLKPIYENVIDGDAGSVESGVNFALAADVDAGIILKEGLIAAMDEVGRRFEDGDFFVPEMLIAARAMQAGLALLKPHLADTDVKAAGRVAIGTVKGDLHDIGKNLVRMMLEGAGFEAVDLGTDVELPLNEGFGFVEWEGEGKPGKAHQVEKGKAYPWMSPEGFGNTMAALRSMARTLSSELVGRGIRVNAISPGPIASTTRSSAATLPRCRNGPFRMASIRRTPMGTGRGMPAIRVTIRSRRVAERARFDLRFATGASSTGWPFSASMFARWSRFSISSTSATDFSLPTSNGATACGQMMPAPS